jgi:hypothetical protein
VSMLRLFLCALVLLVLSSCATVPPLDQGAFIDFWNRGRLASGLASSGGL